MLLEWLLSKFSFENSPPKSLTEIAENCYYEYEKTPEEFIEEENITSQNMKDYLLTLESKRYPIHVLSSLVFAYSKK